MADKVYVATLDTGGISHSGREIVGTGTTEDEAMAACVKVLKGGKSGIRTPYGDYLRTVTDISDYYGIRVYGPMVIGTAVEA